VLAHCLLIPAPPYSRILCQRIACQIPTPPYSCILRQCIACQYLLPSIVAFCTSTLLANICSTQLLRLVPVGCLPYPCPPQFSNHLPARCRDSSLYGRVQTILQDLMLDLLKYGDLRNFRVFAHFAFSHISCTSHFSHFRIFARFASLHISRLSRISRSRVSRAFRILASLAHFRISRNSRFRFLAFSRISRIMYISHSHTVRNSRTCVSCGFRIFAHFAYFAFSRFSHFDMRYRAPPRDPSHSVRMSCPHPPRSIGAYLTLFHSHSIIYVFAFPSMFIYLTSCLYYITLVHLALLTRLRGLGTRLAC
jgi:hypothetical protein